MQVGLACELSNPSVAPRAWRELWEDHLWLFGEAEQLGFDFIGIEEHPFADDAHGPAPLAFAATVLARTSVIRVGSWASVLPLWHPALLAHNWAVLDQISGGRTFITVAPGYRRGEYAAFGLDPRTRPSRMEEGYELLNKALAQTRVTHHGRYWNVEELDVVPPPLQQPYPLWGTAASVPAARRAARHGAHLAATSADPAVHQAYQDELRNQGLDPARFRISLPLSITVTDDDPEEVWHRHRALHVHRYSEVDRYTDESGDANFSFAAEPSRGDVARYRANDLIGRPDEVLAVLDQLRKTLPITDLVCLGPAPGIPLRTEGAAALRRFAAEVLPVVAEW